MQTQQLYPDYDGYYIHEPERFDRPERTSSTSLAESLADRVLKISSTLSDLKQKLAREKELLEREKMLSASMYLLPTSEGYYALDYHTGNTEGEKLIESYHNYANFVDDHGDDTLSYTSSENLMESRKRVTDSQQEIYRKHLKDIEHKCKKELGAVHESINCLKRVSTELHVEINNREQRAIEKEFFYDDI